MKSMMSFIFIIGSLLLPLSAFGEKDKGLICQLSVANRLHTNGVQYSGFFYDRLVGQGYIPPSAVSRTGEYFNIGPDQAFGGIGTFGIGSPDSRVRVKQSFEHVPPASAEEPARIVLYIDGPFQGEMPMGHLDVDTDSPDPYTFKRSEDTNYQLHPNYPGDLDVSTLDTYEINLKNDDGSPFVLRMFGDINQKGLFQISHYELVERDLFSDSSAQVVFPRPVNGWRHSSDYVDLMEFYRTEAMSIKAKNDVFPDRPDTIEAYAKLTDGNQLSLHAKRSHQLIEKVDLGQYGIDSRDILYVHDIDFVYKTDEKDIMAAESERVESSYSDQVYFRNIRHFIVLRTRNTAAFFGFTDEGKLTFLRNIEEGEKISSVSNSTFFTEIDGKDDWIEVYIVIKESENIDERKTKKLFYDPISDTLVSRED